MKFFEKYPVLKIAVPFITGIILCYSGILPPLSYRFLIITIFSILGISSLLYRLLSYFYKWIAGFSIQISFFLCGILLTQFHFSSFPLSGDLHLLKKQSAWIFKITTPPQIGERSVKCFAELQKSTCNRSVNEIVLLYFQRNRISECIKSGDLLLAHIRLSEIPGPRNPEEFNYRKYMKRKGVHFTGYISGNGFIHLDSVSEKSLKNIAHRIQEFFSEQFAHAGISGDEYGVITALLLGNDDMLEPSLRSKYASAGVSHILCVSGMHVGIIFMILNFALKPLRLFKRSALLRTVILLASIWFYAFVTGLGPSVQRAAAMFSFVAFGKLISRPVTVYHSLYTSLLILLLINPLLLFEAGFQLSYMAVFGIVTFQEPVRNIFRPKNRILKYFWELVTVSFTAQLGTVPLSIHYFGQFPNYFLIANLSVISLSFVIVVTGVIVLCLFFSPFLTLFTGKILSLEIKCMNAIIAFIEKLPGSVTDFLYLSVWETLFLYGIIFGSFLFFKFRKKEWYWISLFTCTLYFMTSNFRHISQIKEKTVTFYSVRKNTAIRFNTGEKSILLHTFEDLKSNGGYHFSIYNHERSTHTKSDAFFFEETIIRENMGFYKRGNYIRFQNLSFFVLSKNEKLYRGEHKIKTDYLVITGNNRMTPEKTEAIIEFDFVVLNSTLSDDYVKRWKMWCLERNIPFHSIGESGHFSLTVSGNPSTIKRFSLFL